MKIQRVSLDRHPAIGTVQLDFTDGSGGTFSTIVLAGGNGTGKTAILEAIHRLFEPSLGGPAIGIVCVDLELSDEDRAQLDGILQKQSQMSLNSGAHTFRLVWDSNVTTDWNAYKLSWEHPDARGRQEVPAILAHEYWADFFRSFFSEAAVDFQASSISSVTALGLDDPNQRTVRSGSLLGSQIAQLMVDIRAADAEDLAQWVFANPDQVPLETVKDTRFSRFRAAFEYMFPAKRFSKIERSAGKIEIEFEEFGRVSTLDQLSTGEKQIVFRAGFLLRNLSTVRKSIVLVDEPELSLHPEWQSRITGFYTHLLSDEFGHHPQIIFSTHSPFIVHGAANARAIILQRDMNTGTVSEMPAPLYPGIAGSEAVRAFNIDSFLNSAQKPLLVLTEGESDRIILETAWGKLYPSQSRNFELRAALGDKNVQITLNDQELFAKLGPDRLIVGIFDFDSAFSQWNGVWRRTQPPASLVSAHESAGLVKRHGNQKGWAMLLPVPPFRSDWASQALKGESILSIEFLFADSDIPTEMVSSKPIAQGHSIPFFKGDDKLAFANHVGKLPASSFAAFAPIFERLHEIQNGRL